MSDKNKVSLNAALQKVKRGFGMVKAGAGGAKKQVTADFDVASLFRPTDKTLATFKREARKCKP